MPKLKGLARARCASIWVLALLSLVVLNATAHADTATFAIEPQDLSGALKAFAVQSHREIFFAPELARGRMSHGVKGKFDDLKALNIILEGTGLNFSVTASNAILVRDPASKSGPPPSTTSMGSLPADPPVRVTPGGAATVQVYDNSNTPFLSSSGPANYDKASLSEIVVTAQKREERLIDAPQSVSVISSDELAKLGATQFRDFANTVPGLDFSTSGAGFTQISLRGVTSGLDVSPTVGIYVDEVPYGSSSAFGSGAQLALDVGLFDLDRIEVLRGPQGTLYGASTMGGLIKYVSKRPDTENFSGDIQTGVSGTEHGGVSYDVAGVVNIPIVTDKVALRASGFESRDGGYIDNLALGEKDVNRSDVYGGRLDLLLTPTEALTIRLGVYLQNISRDGEATVDYTFAGKPLYGNLDQYRKSAEPFDQRFRLGSGTLTYDFGPAMLTSISSYQTTRADYSYDYSALYAEGGAYPLGPYSAISLPTVVSTDKFTQEVHLASKGTSILEWLIGGFYTHESSKVTQQFNLLNLAGQPAPNIFFTYYAPSIYEEYATFGDLTWHLTNKFDVTGGIRYARDRETYENIGSGVFVGSEPLTRSSDDVVTYLANARYHFSEHTVGYLRYATGYRPGGPNFIVINQNTGLPYQPLSFQPDSLKSYEAGIKAETADRRFSIDVDGYYIDWNNIQVSTAKGNVGFLINAPGGANILGSELTATAQPISALKITGAFAYQHAYLREADPDLGASAGERLPEVPRFTAAINGDYVIEEEGLRPTVGTTLRYVSDRTASFDGSPRPQYRLPAYTAVDLRSGIAIDRVNVQFYVRNLFDERGQLSALYTNVGTARVAILQPRTIGVTLSTKF